MIEIPATDIHLPEFHLPEKLVNFEWPTIDLSSVDVGKAVTEAAQAAHIVRRPHRSRWPLAVGGFVVASLTGWVVLSNAAFRARLAQGAGVIRERISALWSGGSGALEVDRNEPVAFPAAETAPIESTSLRDDSPGNGAAYPPGLGSNNGDGILATSTVSRPSKNRSPA